MEMFKDFVSDEKAKGDPMDSIVSVAIALILVATLGVASWQLLGNANYTGVDETTKVMVKTVIGIIGAIAVVLTLLRIAKSGQ